MQTSSQPKLLPVPFADAGSKQNIPNDSQIGITAGRASYVDGFPPLTRTPLAAGGVPPFGTDFNGILNDITAALRWSQAGSGYPFNADFNTAISGYPKGARIPNSTLDGFWLNTTDGNSANPENTTSALTGWVPSGFYGTTAITGLSGSSITLTTLQAGRARITLAGTLTANINLIVPAWVKRWEVVNNCTGAFSVTVKTPSGTGVAVPAGLTAVVQGNGTNITQDTPLLGLPGRLIGTQVFTSSGTYTPSPGAKKVRVYVTAAGGAGGGSLSTSNPRGGGGGAGGTAIKLVTLSQASYAVTVGMGSSTATTGGGSSFGSECSAAGGAHGTANAGAVGGVATGGDLNIKGGQGSDGAVSSNAGGGSGDGGASYWGGGRRSSTGSDGAADGAYGAGGGGNQAASGGGGEASGQNGIVYIEEYS